MSGMDTIFECVNVCAHKPQTTWNAARSLISTYPYFPSQVDITINEAHADTHSLHALLKIRIKDQKLSSEILLSIRIREAC